MGTLARWGLVSATVLMGGALLATVWSTHTSVGNASETLLRGQADMFLDGIRLRARRHRGPLTHRELGEVVDDLRADGLLYVAVFDYGGRIKAQAGTPLGTDAETEAAWADARPGTIEEIGGRVRATYGNRRAHRMKRKRRGPRPILIEFDPHVTRQLRTNAGRALGIGGVAAAAFLLMAIGLVRWFIRREALERQIEHERRLANLGAMSAILAHEIKNPLASLKGNAQLLARELPAGERRRAKADRVVAEAIRLENLTNDLLEFARSGDLHRSDAAPSELLRAAATAVSEDRIELDTRNAPAMWPLDAERILQVLTNLLENATQASDGTVSASAREEEGDLVFVVRDRGPGIPPDELDRVFEPFYTKRTRGTGLGLAVSRRIVELHGGAVTAANHDDGGAVFRVSIPRK